MTGAHGRAYRWTVADFVIRLDQVDGYWPSDTDESPMTSVVLNGVVVVVPVSAEEFEAAMDNWLFSSEEPIPTKRASLLREIDAVTYRQQRLIKALGTRGEDL